MLTGGFDESIAFKCNFYVSNYLVYKKHLPLLSSKGNYYYFRKCQALTNAINNSSPLIKFIIKISGEKFTNEGGEK